MNLPKNRYTLFATLWFAAGIYALLHESSGGVAPFPQFDKLEHFALFFAQIWLAAKAFMVEQRSIPYRSLVIFAFLYALLGEIGQATLTITREGSLLDGCADMMGCVAALWLISKVYAAKQSKYETTNL